MQNRYVGDVGKFGLLRRLRGLTDPKTDAPDLKVGLVWYLHPDECRNSDGRHTSYLTPIDPNPEEYGACDSVLWMAPPPVGLCRPALYPLHPKCGTIAGGYRVLRRTTPLLARH